MQAEPNPAAQQFYEEAATAAAALGVCIDVFAASNDGVGLAYLEPLSSISGGAMFLYPSLEDAALPQVHARSHAIIALLPQSVFMATLTHHHGTPVLNPLAQLGPHVIIALMYSICVCGQGHCSPAVNPC